jgi:hypothetical protein
MILEEQASPALEPNGVIEHGFNSRVDYSG